MKFFGKKKLGYWLPLVVILLVGAFFRLYRIGAYATFLGDEGRDALVVYKMIVNRRPTLLGPSTSVGDLYLGPLYYYLMLPPLWLFGFNPVGPAVMVACLGVATIYLVFLLGKEFFSPRAGLFAAALYALSQPIITHTRFSWNPNPVPFFASLAVYSWWRFRKEKRRVWLLIGGACLGALVHLHYVSLAFVATMFGLAFLTVPKGKRRELLFGLGAFGVMILPIFIFELRHNFIISQGFWQFIFAENKLGFSLSSLGGKMFGAVERLFVHFVTADYRWLGYALLLLFLLPLRKKHLLKKERSVVTILAAWFFFGVLGASLYTGDLHDHYLGFLFPVPFLVTGAYLAGKGGRWLKLALLGLLVGVNFLALHPVAGVTAGNQIARSRRVAERIVADWEGERFNLALISPTLDFRAMNYRYFTTILGAPPEGFDNYSDIETLYVIKEQENIPVTDRTAWEIASFGEAEEVVAWQMEESGYWISKLKKKAEEEGE